MPASGIHHSMPSGKQALAQLGQDLQADRGEAQDEDQDRRDDAHALLLAAQDLAAQRMGKVARRVIGHRRRG